MPPLDPVQKKVQARLAALHKDLAGKKKKMRGLYIWGGVGRGKTMLMDDFFESLPSALPKRRVHYHEFMIGVHEELHKARQKGEADKGLLKYAEKTAKKARLLCFDEFHVTDIADAMILGKLFTALFDSGAVCVMTSNWPPDRLYEGGLQRDRFTPFIKTLKEHMDVIELDGVTDYRLKCLTDTGVYFYPLSNRGKADDVFARLTGNAKPVEESITVKGRTIEVYAAAKGVARFSFAQLCERPVGAEDYLTIADAYHTVFLEGVPKLGYDRRNEAKRLMTLVDAFYDKGTKLVITADAPPGQLYGGHDHGFEFQRTVSRLMEMQSSAYLGIANG
jgi:cell division protein ZapE